MTAAVHLAVHGGGHLPATRAITRMGRHFGPRVFQHLGAVALLQQARLPEGARLLRALRRHHARGRALHALLRTFAPFVAGVAQMTRRKFTFYDVTGALLWVVGRHHRLPVRQRALGQDPTDKIIWAMILIRAW